MLLNKSVTGKPYTVYTKQKDMKQTDLLLYILAYFDCIGNTEVRYISIVEEYTMFVYHDKNRYICNSLIKLLLTNRHIKRVSRGVYKITEHGWKRIVYLYYVKGIKPPEPYRDIMLKAIKVKKEIFSL